MIKLLADENLDNTIIRGLLRRNPDIDIVRVQDIDLSGKDDPIVLNGLLIKGVFYLLMTLLRSLATPMRDWSIILLCQESLKFTQMHQSGG